MIKLRLAEPRDFAALRELREAVFRRELGIQHEDYQDVFNDHYSKNFLLERDGWIVGAVRLAFSRELQEYFISYLILLPAVRNLSLLRLLVGAVILTMQRNGIQRVRLHASDDNLQIYLGMGCQVDGPRFKKYGFDCFWTPMIYRLGTNDVAERAVVNHVSAYFPDLAALNWTFQARIALYPDFTSYQHRVWSQSDAAIGETTPHVGTSSLPLRNRWLELRSVPPSQQSPAHNAIAYPPRGGSSDAVDGRFTRRDPIIVRRGSRAHAIATTYSLLSRRHLLAVDDWDDNDWSAVLGAASAFVVLDSDELASFAGAHAMLEQRLPIGVAVAADPGGLSRLLLRNYFDFIGPFAVAQWNDDRGQSSFWSTPAEGSLTARLCAVPRQDFTDIVAEIEPLFVAGRVRSHCIVGCHYQPRQAATMLDCLLASGFAVGAAVRFVNLAYQAGSAKQLMLVGDPALRLHPSLPRIVENSARPRDANGCARIMAFGAPIRLLHAAGFTREQMQEAVNSLEQDCGGDDLHFVSFLDGTVWQTFAHRESSAG